MGSARFRLDRSRGMLLGFAIVLALLPLALGSDNYTLQLLIMAMIWGAVAQAWDLLLGYAGVFNLGQIGFFAIGGYASAMLSYHLGVSPWIGLVAGLGAGAAIAVLIGLPCLRLSGIYVALLTLAFFEVLGPLLTVGKAVGTGGKEGLFPLDVYRIGDYAFTSSNPIPWYYMALALFLVCLTGVYLVITSRFGTSFIALHDSESFAQSLGVDRYRTSLTVVAISGGLTGLMGAFYAHYTSVLSPRLLGLDLFLFLVIMVLLGGVGKFPGAALGAFLITFVNDWLRPAGTYRLLVLGAMVVVIVMLAPRGLMGAIDPVRAFLGKRRAQRASRSGHSRAS